MRNELGLLLGMLAIVIFTCTAVTLTSIDRTHEEEVRILELKLQKKQHELELKECQSMRKIP